jgi:hypothetical protein
MGTVMGESKCMFVVVKIEFYNLGESVIYNGRYDNLKVKDLDIYTVSKNLCFCPTLRPRWENCC